ncbi:hypothetical protein R3P38DRAFT_2932081 [Favolaschia claudopus]|uniref:Uncharacterized protein n=1 Tax=Favolaschia claudopus TaxID=2862362 RepID=A0AAW0BU29_9AGAR
MQLAKATKVLARRVSQLSLPSIKSFKSRPAALCTLAEREAAEEVALSAENSTSHRRAGTETRKTAFNALYVSLRTLSAVSSRIPMGTPLSAVIDPLLDLTDRLEQTSINTNNIDQIAGANRAAHPSGQIFVDSLKRSAKRFGGTRELYSISMELQAAQVEGKLAQFFNADYNMAIIEKHNMALAQLIADSTLVTVHEVLISLRALEDQTSKTKAPVAYPVTGKEISRIRGMGGYGFHAGGEGGLGEGPKLDMDLDELHQIPFGNVSGGTGGQGGNSSNVGGSGGTGEGPVISVRRNRFLAAVEPGLQKRELIS